MRHACVRQSSGSSAPDRVRAIPTMRWTIQICRRTGVMDSAQTRMSDVTAAPRTIARWSVEQDRVFDLQLEFNLFPARYAHPSWSEHIDQQGVDANWREPIEPSPFWIRQTSTRLLTESSLQDSFDCDFNDASRRIALLDSVALRR